MNITLNILGIMKEYIGEDTVSFEFAGDASFGDLLAKIHSRYADHLPESLWDKKTQQFRPGILCVGEGRDLESKETVLKNGEVISVAVHMAGG
jgi:molybdopterin converting factor small subunit